MPLKLENPRLDWIYNRNLIDSLPSSLAMYAMLRRLAVIIPGKRIHAPATFALLGYFEARLASHYRHSPEQRFQKINAAWGPHWVDLGDQRIGMVLRELCDVDPTLELFPLLLADYDVFLDIGSNHGTFAMSASKSMRPEARILAFEPQTHLAKLIERTFKENSLTHATVFNLALSDKTGHSLLVEHSANSGVAQLETTIMETVEYDAAAVECACLDEIIGRPDIEGQRWVMKIDVEGHELNVLRGGQSVLREWHPLIICEINAAALKHFSSSADDLLSFLRGFGYDIFIDVEAFPEALSTSKVNSAEHAYNFVALSSVHHGSLIESIRRSVHDRSNS